MLHQYFRHPREGGAIRSYYLAKALVENGHRVVVLTGGLRNCRETENVEGIEVVYLPVAYDNRFGFYRRGWAFVSYIVKASGEALAFKDFDVCYAISVPLTVGLAACWIKFRFRIPYIFEVGDLWPDAPIQMGFIKNSLLKGILFRLERTSYRESKFVVALSPTIQSAVAKKIPGKRIELIPNMADCDFYRPEMKSSLLESQFDVREKFVVSYIGALGAANGLDYLLDCAQLCINNNLRIHFLICGDGAMRENLETRLRQDKLTNVSLLPFAVRDGVREILNVTDAVFVCYKDVPILETGSPNKFFDALAAGKLIIVNCGGWIRHEIKENKCGIYVDPRKPSDFEERIKPFIDDMELLRLYQAAARKLGEAKYSRRSLSEKFTSLFS